MPQTKDIEITDLNGIDATDVYIEFINGKIIKFWNSEWGAIYNYYKAYEYAEELADKIISNDKKGTIKFKSNGKKYILKLVEESED